MLILNLEILIVYIYILLEFLSLMLIYKLNIIFEIYL